jgi:hypothetical protein
MKHHLIEIDQMAQNKPSYIVDDLAHIASSEDRVYWVLLRRGVFKWLAVRRRLIRLKDEWKRRAKDAAASRQEATGAQVNYWKGYIAALNECRAEVRALCHSPRVQVPDHDSRARRWLHEQMRADA